MAIPVYQSLEAAPIAFGVAFQGRTRRPHFIEPLSRATIGWEVVTPVEVHTPGDSIYIRVKVKDQNQLTIQQFNPDTSMQIRLINPAGTEVVAYTGMSNEALGEYSFTYQTTGASPLGLWTAQFKAINGSATGLSLPMGVFVLKTE